MGFFHPSLPSLYAASKPHLIIPFSSRKPYTHRPPLIVGVTQPNSLSYKNLPWRLISVKPSCVRYGTTASKLSSMIFISSCSRGAPASPSSQQPPLHLFRSHTNLASTN